ncbi:uncharacterized protein FAM241A isoform X2 [Elgaria multicarinata webbii]|uniref:uncharacterized protein FAM241A isoform X2 n=1 Tax=Elgaria multicarinata webbii TaxID=159646 RepID=UPI002FCCBE64
MGSTEELLLLPPPECAFEREWAPSLPSLGGRAGARHRRLHKPPPQPPLEEEEEEQQQANWTGLCCALKGPARWKRQ